MSETPEQRIYRGARDLHHAGQRSDAEQQLLEESYREEMLATSIARDDERFERMLKDPEAYFAAARERARADAITSVAADLDRIRRRRKRRRGLRFPWGWLVLLTLIVAVIVATVVVTLP